MGEKGGGSGAEAGSPLDRQRSPIVEVNMVTFKNPWYLAITWFSYSIWRRFDISPGLSRSTGFAVVLLVINYLQAGCSPPVLPALQKDFPELFRSTEYDVISKLTGSAPPQVKSYKSKNTQNLGELLIGFFKYYSSFDWKKTISVRMGNTQPTSRYGRVWSGPYIKLEDPTDEGNVTRGVYNSSEFTRIKNAFESASSQLEQKASLQEIFLG